MPHLTIEYSANLEAHADIQAFCVAMRDAMASTGIFPLGGIRVRAFPCQIYVIADGDLSYCYLNMICRIGSGRDLRTRQLAAEYLYSAAEDYLSSAVDTPLALSLDFDELSDATSIKRYNTIHADMKNKGCA